MARRTLTISTTSAQGDAETTTSYILRDIDAAVWKRFRARAGAQGIAARSALLGLIAAYAEGALDVEQQTTTTTQVVARASR